ncbi:hypothetical protein MAR_017856 [Mya arenaria]|uniref:Integrase core domain-containing protein n=1 Tax=Mya arenaria TaxID=6604 RepID=A0ABY7EGV9_MYAAR|nr:hypothetical protein MAR_017856 [Mya arenaria]
MTQEIVEMKNMLRVKLCHVIQCIENGRTLNIEEKMRETYELMQQLSLLTCLDGAFELCKASHGLDKCHLECAKRGRPKFLIPVSVIEFLVDNKFTVKDISRLLMTSESTLKRRLKDYNIKIGNTYSIIEQGELEDLVRNITNEYPNAGYRTVMGVLSSKGHRVQEKRVRDALKYCDPQGVLFRRIERLWREVWTGCNALYYGLFFSMEDDGILDVTNERHMLALHLVFKPRIQQHLDNFREAIYHRPLRTERNKSPLQLWISGQMLDPKWNPNNEDELQTFGMEFGDLTS